MLSAKARLERLFASGRFDALLIANNTVIDPNFTYLTGLSSSGMLFGSALLIALPKKEILFSNALEYQVAKSQKPREMEVVNLKSKRQLLRYFRKYLRNKRVGISGNFIPVNSYRILKRLARAKSFVDCTGNFYAARSLKDKGEIQNIRMANRIIKRALGSIQKYLKEGVTETKIASIIDTLVVEYGASGTSFPTLVCFGKNSAVPHHLPGKARLQRNSFVLIDCGARYNDYCSDVTRTFIFKPDKKSEKYKRMLEMYNTVKNAQKLALGRIKPGIQCQIPHRVAEYYINHAYGARYKGKFIHRLGHAIGIETHDLGPSLGPGTKERIKENMVFSDEPGIYVDGFGGVRIEDDVLVTKRGGVII